MYTNTVSFAPIVVAILSFFLGNGASGQLPSGNLPGRLKVVAKEYQVDIQTCNLNLPFQTPYGAINADAAEPQAIENYSNLLVEEVLKYPPNLIQCSSLKRIVLCRNLTFANHPRAAVPDLLRTLYLDVALGSQDRHYQRVVFHHEFFHIIDYCDDGKLYEDDVWSSLNPNGFRYKGAESKSLSAPLLATSNSGFVSFYSTTGVEEDKAEVFARMMVDQDFVRQRAAEDKTLNAKVKHMRKLLVQFCPDMDDEYWERLTNWEPP